MNNFIVIWRYKVKSEKISEFEKLYGQDGDWIKLFKKYPSYIKAEFFKENGSNNIYLTLDYWKSKEAYYQFKENSKNEFFEVDKKGEKLTDEEKNIGKYIQLNSTFN